MAQRYTHATALERMAAGTCPECGESPGAHSDDQRFWIPRRCDLTAAGVTDRVEQYRADVREAAAARPKVRTFITTMPQLSSDARQYEIGDDPAEAAAALRDMPDDVLAAITRHATRTTALTTSLDAPLVSDNDGRDASPEAIAANVGRLFTAIADAGAAIEALPPHQRKPQVERVLAATLADAQRRRDFVIGVFITAHALRHHMTPGEAWPTGCGCSTSPDRPEGGDPTGCYCTCSDDGRDDCEHGEPHPAELFARQDETRAAAEREIDAALAAPATGERRLKPRRKTLAERAAERGITPTGEDIDALTGRPAPPPATVWVRTRKMRDGERVPGPWHIMETDYKSLCGRRPQRVVSAEQRVEPPAPDDHLCVECVRHREQGTSRAVRS